MNESALTLLHRYTPKQQQQQQPVTTAVTSSTLENYILLVSGECGASVVLALPSLQTLATLNITEEEEEEEEEASPTAPTDGNPVFVSSALSPCGTCAVSCPLARSAFLTILPSAQKRQAQTAIEVSPLPARSVSFNNNGDASRTLSLFVLHLVDGSYLICSYDPATTSGDLNAFNPPVRRLAQWMMGGRSEVVWVESVFRSFGGDEGEINSAGGTQTLGGGGGGSWFLCLDEDEEDFDVSEEFGALSSNDSFNDSFVSDDSSVLQQQQSEESPGGNRKVHLRLVNINLSLPPSSNSTAAGGATTTIAVSSGGGGMTTTAGPGSTGGGGGASSLSQLSPTP